MDPRTVLAAAADGEEELAVRCLSSSSSGSSTSSSTSSSTTSTRWTGGASRQLPPPPPGCCAPAWPGFWAVVLLWTVGYILSVLIFLDLATTAFNGGVDPCEGGQKTSRACKEAVFKTTTTTVYFTTVAAVLSFICSPLIGVVCERWGIKPIIVTVVLAAWVHIVINAGVAYAKVSIYLSFAMVEFVAMVPPKVAFTLWITEMTEPHERVLMFARLGAATGLDGIVVPLISILVPRRLIPMVMVPIATVALLVAILVLHGPKPQSQQQQQKQLHQQGVDRQSLAQRLGLSGLSAMWKHGTNRLVLIVCLMGAIAKEGDSVILWIYLKERFGANATSLAPVLALYTLSSMLVQLLLVKPLERTLGLKCLVTLAYIWGIVTNLGYIFAPSLPWLYVVSTVAGLTTLAAPGMLAVFANTISKEVGGMGVTVGAYQSVGSMGAIFGPLIFRVLYACFLKPNAVLPFAFPGAPFLLSILIDCCAIVLLAQIPDALFPRSSEGEGEAAVAAAALPSEATSSDSC